MTGTSVPELVAAYRDALVEMDAIRLEVDTDASSWNRRVHRVQRVQLELRKTPEGRAAVAALIDDPVPTVAQWAASHALFWSEERARAHLEAERSAGGSGSFNAEMILREFEAGRLRHDWEPPRGR